jgi:hypothetical protein
LIRIAACGHTIAHLPQSMQRSASQIGISVAIVRFSTRAVPVRERAVRRQSADRQQIAFTGKDPGRDALDELRDVVADRRAAVGRRRHGGTDRHGEQMGKRRVDGLDVSLHDEVATLSVGRDDRRPSAWRSLVGR